MIRHAYTIAEASVATGISEEEIKTAIESGVIPAELSQNIGDYLIKHDDLMAYAKFVAGKKSTAEIITTKKVLIIDDEFNFANIMKLEFERDARFEGKIATYGKDGILLAKKFCPDVILIDFMLPDITGEKVLEELRNIRQTRNTKVIVYSTHTEEAIKRIPNLLERLNSLGADQFISKSNGMKPLVAKVYQILGLNINTRPTKK